MERHQPSASRPISRGTRPAPPPDASGSVPSDPGPDPTLRDTLWMARALEMARLARVRNEVPVGAVVTRGGELLAEGYNRTNQDSDPTAHAEVVAIRKAARRLGSWRLTDCALYATLEPCTLCAGAVVLSRVPRLVYAADDPKAGMAGSLENLVQDSRLNHEVSLTRGVLAEASSRLLKEFFRERRS